MNAKLDERVTVIAKNDADLKAATAICKTEAADSAAWETPLAWEAATAIRKMTEAADFAAWETLLEWVQTMVEARMISSSDGDKIEAFILQSSHEANGSGSSDSARLDFRMAVMALSQAA